MEQEDYSLIEKYLDQKLTKAETQEFEHRIEKDKRLTKALAMARSRNRFLQNRADIDIVKGIIQNIDKKYRPKPAPKPTLVPVPRRNIIRLAAAAALVLITAISTRKFLSKSPYKQFAEHRLLSGELGEKETLSLKQTFKAYNSKNYKMALAGFEKLPAQQIEENPEITLAKGICYLELNQYKEAADIFTRLTQSQTTYRNEGNWYLALTALKQNDVATCRQFLAEIDPASSYQEQVKELLVLIK